MKAIPLLFAALAATISCDRVISVPEPVPGILSLSFSADATRAGEIPDTNSFILNIIDDGGDTVWAGIYADAPKELSLKPGEYSVEAVSRTFMEPLFEAPQYGDRRTVDIESGKVAAVHLSCTQLNSAVRLVQTPQFIADYPGGTFYVQSASGTLMYSYGEKRTGYFYPGTVWLIFNHGGTSHTLATREVAPREVLVLRIGTGASVKEVGPDAERWGDGITMDVDTCRIWTVEDYSYGSGNGSGGNTEDLSGAYSVGQARAKAASGEKDVWVYGYIAGGDCSSRSCSFTPPFTSNTNLLLAPDRNSADKDACLAVQLRQGAIRDAINLVEHPELLGRMVYLKGDLVEKYYGIPGLQNLDSYRIQ